VDTSTRKSSRKQPRKRKRKETGDEHDEYTHTHRWEGEFQNHSSIDLVFISFQSFLNKGKENQKRKMEFTKTDRKIRSRKRHAFNFLPQRIRKDVSVPS